MAMREEECNLCESISSGSIRRQRISTAAATTEQRIIIIRRRRAQFGESSTPALSSRSSRFSSTTRAVVLWAVVASCLLCTMMRLRIVSAAWSSSSIISSTGRIKRVPLSQRSGKGVTTSLSATDSRELRFFGGGTSMDHIFRSQAAESVRVSKQQSAPGNFDENTSQADHHHHQSDAFLAVAEEARKIAASMMRMSTKTTATKTTVYASSSRTTTSTTTTTTTTSTTAMADPLLTVRAGSTSTVSSSSSTTIVSPSNTAAGLYRSFHSSPPDNGNDEQGEVSSTTSSLSSSAAAWDDSASSLLPRKQQPQQGYGTSIQLSDEEYALFSLLRKVRQETGLGTTLRVAGGWVRDKLLATPEFQTYHTVFDVGAKQGLLRSNSSFRLTSKFRTSKTSKSGAAPSAGRQGTKVLLSANGGNDCQPVDIDIALDDMLGKEFADHLNEYLSAHGSDTISVGVVLKNPEKSKHLETATMKVGSFWIDFVNLRAEEYTQESRIPDLMRIGTASEDAFRRDLTINALFYNINTGQVEDWTGRGFEDLRKGIVATPLAPLTTLLDDPLRVLRSIRFAARLRFNIDEELGAAARDERVRNALAQKVSRERVGSEVDLMLRSPDPVGAMRHLIDLNLVETVFPIMGTSAAAAIMTAEDNRLLFTKGLSLLSMANDHLADCRWSPPLWCKSVNSRTTFGTTELRLIEDEETRRLLWYASFLKPIWDQHQLNIRGEEAEELQQERQSCSKTSKRKGRGKKANRSPVSILLVDYLKRPTRDAESIEKIIKAADEITDILNTGGAVSATMVLLSDLRVVDQSCLSLPDGCPANVWSSSLSCSMNGRTFDSAVEEDPVWEHAMEFRLSCSKLLKKAGPLWRAALFLALSQELDALENSGLAYTTQGDAIDERQQEHRGTIVERYDVFAAALQQLGLIGIWNQDPLLNGGDIKANILPRLPKGPAFRVVMEEQDSWMTTHPGASAEALEEHLRIVFPQFTQEGNDDSPPQKQSRKKKNDASDALDLPLQ